MTRLKDGAYELKDVVGKGAFGEVFRATTRASNHVNSVAIKKSRLLRDDELRRVPDPQAEAKILKELSKISDAKHVIAEYIDSFVEGEFHYLVMFYCPHGSIYDYLSKNNRRPFSEAQVSVIAYDILTALEFIHGADYVHRDLSPKNILIHAFTFDQMPQIKLVDFGLTKKIALINNTVAGTPGFFDRDRMKKGKYSKEVDFFALGCVLYFMLTGKLLDSKDGKISTSSKEVEADLRQQSLKNHAIDLVLLLLSNHNVQSAQEVKIHRFFTNDVLKEAEIQASSIRKSVKSREYSREPLKDVQNKPSELSSNRYNYRPKQHRPAKAGSHAQSLPTKLTVRHPSKISVASSNSQAVWPLPVQDFRYIVKNVMVNKLGRAILRGPDKTFICETLNSDNICTYVGHLLNAGSYNQELIIYKPENTFCLPDFTRYPNGLPESELKVVKKVSRPGGLNDPETTMARSMYNKMRSILKAVCDMVRKREENPSMIVDSSAKITWGGDISVELPDKMVIKWNCKNQLPPINKYPNLPQNIKDMLSDIHDDYRRLFSQRSLSLRGGN